MSHTNKYIIQAFIAGILLFSCSKENDTRSLLEDYPLEQTAFADQIQGLSDRITIDKYGNKDLEPGIYCASISYYYGDKMVGNVVLKDGILYGKRTDTIEVEISKSKIDKMPYISAFIMNKRRDIYSLPESDENKTINSNIIEFNTAHYYIPKDGDLKKGMGLYSIELNKHTFINYNIYVFAKGGQCANNLSVNVPSIDETLTVNLKHELLLPEAKIRAYESARSVTSQLHNDSENQRNLDNEKYNMNLSQDDKDYLNQRAKERFDDHVNTMSSYDEEIKEAREGSKRLIPGSIIPDQPVSENAFAGIISRIKNYFSRSVEKTIEVSSLSSETSITVSKGDRIEISATGEISLGIFAGSTSPDGIDGFSDYSKIRELKHGCLIGKIGNDSWFFIGSKKSLVAQTNGQLVLQVNDNDSSNNSGKFIVNYKVN